MSMPSPTKTDRKKKSNFGLIISAVPVLLLATALTAVYRVMSESASSSTAKIVAPSSGHGNYHFQYTTVTGFFAQDEIKTIPETFDPTSQNFGLLDQAYDTDVSLPDKVKSYKQWERFAHKLQIMNGEAPQGTTYRLLFLGRHGQGHHNVGSEFYGSNAWDCYYSTLDADPTSPIVVFSDAHLTKVGISQAEKMSSFWKILLTNNGIPAPQRFYVSPLSRAIQTAEITFGPLGDQLKKTSPFRPIVKELLREGHGIHTCDRRPSKTYLKSTFKNLVFPDNETFTETDELYSPDFREPPPAHVSRLRLLLDDVFESDSSTYISMTSHSGSIGAILRAVGHRDFTLLTGGAIPVLVKVEKVSGKSQPFDLHDKTGWEVKPDCIGDPAKAGKPGFKDIGEYLKYIENQVVA